MTTAPSKPLSPIILFVQWMLFSSFGWFIGLGLGVFLNGKITGQPGIREGDPLPYVILLSVGLTLGFSQSLVLRSLLPGAQRWLRYTLAGFALAVLVFILASLVRLPLEGLLDDALWLALSGAAVALPQWRLLRQHFNQVWLWIVASALGWLGFLWLAATPAVEIYELIVRGLLYSLVGLALQGVVLVWLQRAQQKTPPALLKGKRK